MSSSSSPCAACKFLRRKCPQECVFAPYFPPDQPQRFVNVHKVFGASNVAKILNELAPNQREDAVNSLAYEAEARLRDPVYGCVGLISILQHTLKQIQMDLDTAKNELASLGGPAVGVGVMQQQHQHHMLHQDPYIQAAAGQFHHPNSMGVPSSAGPSNANLMQYNMAIAAQMMGIPGGGGGGGSLGLMIGENKVQAQQLDLGVVGGGGQLMMRDHHQPGGGPAQLLMREPNMLQQQQQLDQNSQSQITNNHSPHQIMDAQQLVAAMQVKEEQELMRNLEQQQQHGHHLHYQQQQQFLRFDGGFDVSSGPAGQGMAGPSAVEGDGEVSGSAGGGRFGQMGSPTTAVVDHMSPSLALGSGYNTTTSSTTYHQMNQHLHQHNQQQQPQEQQHHHHQQAPLMLLQGLDPHHHQTQQQQPSPELEVSNHQIIPQQFFQEQPGRSGGASQEEGRNSSSSSVGTSFREDFQKVNL